MSRWHDSRAINRMYREWVADTTILHSIQSWERWTAERGWTITNSGLIRTSELEARKGDQQ
jgi:hypothetical protein